MKEGIWIALAIVGWGVWAIVLKMATKSMSPFLIVLTSAYVYSAYAPIMYLGMKAKGMPFDWNLKGIMWSTAAVSLAILANYSFLFAVQHRPVNEVMSWTQTYPVLSFVLCWLFMGETFTLARVIGIAMVVAGMVVMNR